MKNSLKKQFLTITISVIAQLTMSCSAATHEVTIERYKQKTEAIKACIDWLKKGKQYTYFDDGTWREENSRMCVDGSKDYNSKDIAGMEDVLIEATNYDDIPYNLDLKIVKFFTYRKDDGTSLNQ